MKTSVKKRSNYWGLIGLAMSFLFAAVPISIQVAAADGQPHYLAKDQEIDGCGILNVQDRQTADDSFFKRVSAVRKQLGTDSL